MVEINQIRNHLKRTNMTLETTIRTKVYVEVGDYLV